MNWIELLNLNVDVIYKTIHINETYHMKISDVKFSWYSQTWANAMRILHSFSLHTSKRVSWYQMEPTKYHNRSKNSLYLHKYFKMLLEWLFSTLRQNNCYFIISLNVENIDGESLYCKKTFSVLLFHEHFMNERQCGFRRNPRFLLSYVEIRKSEVCRC